MDLVTGFLARNGNGGDALCPSRKLSRFPQLQHASHLRWPERTSKFLKIRIEIQLHDRATRRVDDRNPVIHADFLTMARQLTWIMNGCSISNQLSFACSGYGGSSHSRWARTTFKARHWSRVFLALWRPTIGAEQHESFCGGLMPLRLMSAVYRNGLPADRCPFW